MRSSGNPAADHLCATKREHLNFEIIKNLDAHASANFLDAQIIFERAEFRVLLDEFLEHFLGFGETLLFALRTTSRGVAGIIGVARVSGIAPGAFSAVFSLALLRPGLRTPSMRLGRLVLGRHRAFAIDRATPP